MDSNPFNSIDNFSKFVAELLNRKSIVKSTVSIWSASPYTGIAEGEIFFSSVHKLRMREEIDFEDTQITSYGYEIYLGDERLYWYDDFPHPSDPNLATTLPHHKHIPPDIKRNRQPTSDISFFQPNLPFIIQEIEALK
jgi:hypothetical protein